ncbi:MAG: DUF72 domain-containing protein [Ignavibacteriaceae bacterium]|nr:DUF72 domain-containing protein [Ignavibacteriaceae bacterium]
MSSKLKIGTCSWNYDSWTGLVYSGLPGSNYLTEYSSIYNTVEVDRWFWSLFPPGKVVLPNLKDVNDYFSAVNKDFRFTIKAPNSISLTHFYSRDTGGTLIENPNFLSPELYEKFLKSIEPLHPVTGVIIIQFEYLNKQKMGSQNEFLQLLEKFAESVDKSIKIGIEIRNPNYLNKKFFETLNRTGFIPVFLHGYFMPDALKVIRDFANYIPGTAVLRLHGPDRTGIEKKTKNIWNEVVEPKDFEIGTIAEVVRELLEREIELYINVNNHYEGSAPLTIEKIKTAIAG